VTQPAFTPTVWTKTVDGKTYEKTATRIDDEVQYRFDGWLPKKTKDAKAEVANQAAVNPAPEQAPSARAAEEDKASHKSSSNK
jgi:hypothetical protein